MSEVIHVVIPDAHSKPNTNPRRFIALGNFLLDFAKKNKDAEIKVIEMGDFEDMESLSSFDLGKLSFEGRRLDADIVAAQTHRDMVYKPLNNWLAHQKAQKKKVPKVELHALGGNHFEGRLKRYVQKHSELSNMLSVESLMPYAEWNLKYTPFLTPIDIDGILYVHYWQQRGTGKPVATGKYPAQVLIREIHRSTVVGHSHVFDRATHSGTNGTKIFALTAGCYLDPDEKEDYAGQSNDHWWKGISVLRGVEGGYPTAGESYVPVSSLLAEYCV